MASQEAYVLTLDAASPRQLSAQLFCAPSEVICAAELAEVMPALRRMDAALASGFYVAGYVAYEAGYALEPRLQPLALGLPRQTLLWMGIFERCEELDAPRLANWLRDRSGRAARCVAPPQFAFDVSREEYSARIRRIHEYIRAGETYQVNYTLRCRFEFDGTPAELLSLLLTRQRTRYSALIEDGERAVISLSPELFFRKRGSTVELRPMKGTASRGRNAVEDEELARWLEQDEKSRAENVMIVDLLRSDIGRVARAGSVTVPELFRVERYETLHQMTSRIQAELEPDVGLSELMATLFPCGSVTGAPKIRTMGIIRELESTPRGIYTGAIGSAAPDGRACFNVAIRTISLQRDGHATLGVGSGITIDSEANAEYDECCLKAAFLTNLGR